MLSIIATILAALVLYAACAFLLALEIFLPSLGLLTLFAVGAFAYATYLFFQISPVAGWWGLASAVVIIPLCWVAFYKIFPRTAIGKAMILKSSPRPKGDGLPLQDQLTPLVGQRGMTASPLRPVGVCRIGNLRVVCQSEIGYIPQNRTIEVVAVQGQTVIVRQIDDKKDIKS